MWIWWKEKWIYFSIFYNNDALTLNFCCYFSIVFKDLLFARNKRLMKQGREEKHGLHELDSLLDRMWMTIIEEIFECLSFSHIWNVFISTQGVAHTQHLFIIHTFYGSIKPHFIFLFIKIYSSDFLCSFPWTNESFRQNRHRNLNANKINSHELCPNYE